MKYFLSLALAAGVSLLIAGGVSAQGAGWLYGLVGSSTPSYSNGETRPVSLTTTGALRVADGGGCAGQSEASTNVTPINLTASGRLITGTSSQKVRICAINLVVASAVNASLVEGTGSTCGTSAVGLAGGATAATGWNLAANGGLAEGNGLGVLFRTTVNANDVCLLLSGSVQTSGTVTWVSF